MIEETVSFTDKLLKEFENKSTQDDNYKTSYIIFKQLSVSVKDKIKSEKNATTVYFAASLKSV